jgi:adenylosuccinate synthase
MVDVLLGLQWGDEGKGKIVDFLAKEYDIIARFQGGPNAGHTLYVNDKKVVLHTIPSGIFHKHIINIIGNGVVLDPVTFAKECNTIKEHGVDLKANLRISEKTHIIIPTHRALDKASEEAKGTAKIGSTLKGIGPAYMDKTGRNGLRVGDVMSADFQQKYDALKAKHFDLLRGYNYSEEINVWEKEFFESLDTLRSMTIINAEYWLEEQLQSKKKILAEGAQGSMLDVDFGTYPFVTSSNTTVAGVCSGLGISPKYIDRVYGITKAYCTRVGGGPFPTELDDEVGEELRKLGNEFGSTTGRSRRCGWIDLVALRYACMVSGVDTLIMTKADVLNTFEWINACVAYEIDGKQTTEFPFDICNTKITPIYKELRGWRRDINDVDGITTMPAELIKLIDEVEGFTKARVKYVSNGVGRDQIVKI